MDRKNKDEEAGAVAGQGGADQAAGKAKPDQSREERLAEALRANLRRRKSAAKARKDEE